MMNRWIQSYLEEHARVIRSLPSDKIESWIQTLKIARSNSARIFICGNGGSASNSSHFAVDLGKGASGLGAGTLLGSADQATNPRFQVLSLTDNVAWMTALGNDLSYADIFVEQLKNYARPGDVFIGISVSGNSPNIVKAMDWAGSHQMTTLAMVGNKQDNQMSKLGRQVIQIDSQHYGRVEDAQMTILHMLCYAFIEGVA